MAESVLTNNAFLNPLLGSTLGSVRAFSSKVRCQAVATATEEHDLSVQDIPDTIERKSSNNSGPSSNKKQAVQSRRLLRDLRASAAPEINQERLIQASVAPEALTLQALASRVADLEATLKAAEAIDWAERYSRAQQGLSIKNRLDTKNLSQRERSQVQRKAQEQYENVIADIRQDRAEHEVLVTQMRATIATLKGHLSQRNQKLVDLRKKKLELLKKRDELAVKMAELRAGRKPGRGQVRVTSQTEAVKTSGETASPSGTQAQPSSLADLPSINDTIPVIHSSTSHFDIRNLRLHMPGNIVKIDSSLTIDLTSSANIKQLREQLSALQARLREFHPPLDTLPADIKPMGKGPNKGKAYMLRTWLRILVSRYQAKTGVLGEPVEAKKVRELSSEAKERMARRWNEIFGAKRGFWMDVEEMKMEGSEEMSRKAEQAAEPTRFEDDYDEQAFLRGDFDTEEGMLAAQDEPEIVQKAGQAPRSVTRREGAVSSTVQGTYTRHPDSRVQRRAYSTRAPSLDTLNTSLQQKEKESTSQPQSPQQPQQQPTPAVSPPPHLPHLTSSGTAHMVPITHKPSTSRTAIAVGTVYFSNPTPLSLITSNSLKKGDVLSVSRIAGVMAAKKCPEIVPLCHPIMLTHVGVELRTFESSTTDRSSEQDGDTNVTNVPTGPDDMAYGGVQIECTVACAGSTGVEMEALTAVMGTALSVVDMCKAVDKFQRIGDVRIVLKEGGKSGVWREEGWTSWQDA